MQCFCFSNAEFTDCCQPFLSGISKPLTAEALMRSRFSAYATVAIEYLWRSTQPSKRKFYDRQSIENWAKSNEWQKLEIVSKKDGETKDKTGIVEFKAYYLDTNKQPQTHHERSSFVKKLGKWFYLDGEILS